MTGTVALHVFLQGTPAPQLEANIINCFCFIVGGVTINPGHNLVLRVLHWSHLSLEY